MILFLFLVTKVEINISFIIGVFLLSVAVKDYSPKIDKYVKLATRYEKAYLGVMGFIHGLTNLGGSLLTAIVHSKDYEKHITRVTVAISYATFAAFQIITLFMSGVDVDLKLMGIVLYLVVGVAIYFLTEKLVYAEINNENYSKFFAIFLFVSGVLLIVKSI